MRICYCLATTDMEGGAKSLLDLLKGVKSNDSIEPFVILTKHHLELENELRQMQIKYKIIYHGTDCKTKNKIKQLIKVIVNKISINKIKKFLTSNKIDLLHNNSVLSLVGMIAASELKIPYICHVRESIEDDLNLKMMNYQKLYNLMSNSFKCIYISNAVYDRYKNYVTSNNNIIIYDGIDTKKYILQKEDVLYDFNKILFVGRISKGKGQLDAIKAINYLVTKYKLNYVLTIIGTIGDENYYEEILQYIKKNNLENYVKIISYSSDLKEYRKKNRIALVCSEKEGLGRVTIEAMLSRQIVIGSSSGATKEIIKDNVNGYLYEPHNIEQLAEIIKNTNETDVKKIIENGYKYAINEFENEKETEKVIELYNQK